jgi:hypothetical protein
MTASSVLELLLKSGEIKEDEDRVKPVGQKGLLHKYVVKGKLCDVNVEK